ncbi:MAG: LolA family protein [Planctomycetota bacterium]|jgi:outer membrane lipoprotein-sorting protein
MRPSENMEKLIKKLRYKASAETHDRVLGNVLQSLDENQMQKPGVTKPDLWRIIMKTKMTKLAAASVIIVAVLVGIHQFGSNGASAVFASVVEQLHYARTMTYSIVTNTPVESMPTLRLQIAFKEPGYMRTTTADGYITVIDWAQNKGITLWPPKREYIDFEASNYQHDPAQDPFMVVEKLRTLPSQADEVLGEKEIDGRVLQGFRVTKDDMINTVWVDPQTTQLVRVEIEYTNSPGMNTIMTDFQFNVELDDSLFSLTPTEGYTRLEVQADVSTVTEEDLIAYLHMWSTWTQDSTFPPTFNPIELPKVTAEMIKQGMFGQGETSQQQRGAEATQMYRGIMFMTQLPAESNWRYAGENVKYGDAQTPIFWYQPSGSATYRVIYGDLSVRDVAPENLPK